MGLLAIQISDRGIQAARSGTEPLLAVDGEQQCSPGFARVHGADVVTGLAAARQLALHPLQVVSRFWSQLDTNPVHPRDPRSPNRAEVACAHLQQALEGHVQPEDDLVIAVPADYEHAQLRLLAGIARELGLPLRALVAHPVAIDPGEAGAEAFLVVDLGLYHGTVSMVGGNAPAVLIDTRVSPQVGLLSFRRQWVKAIGDAFVRTSRFDPLHDAATEQRLHDQLPELLEMLAAGGTAPVALSAGTQVHRVTVTEQMLAQCGQSDAFALAADVESMFAAHRVTSILLTDAAAQVPGLQRAMQQQVPVRVQALPAGAAARGLVQQWPDQFDQSAAPQLGHHTRRWPGGGAPKAKASALPSEVDR